MPEKNCETSCRREEGGLSGRARLKTLLKKNSILRFATLAASQRDWSLQGILHCFVQLITQRLMYMLDSVKNVVFTLDPSVEARIG